MNLHITQQYLRLPGSHILSNTGFIILFDDLVGKMRIMSH